MAPKIEMRAPVMTPAPEMQAEGLGFLSIVGIVALVVVGTMLIACTAWCWIKVGPSGPMQPV